MEENISENIKQEELDQIPTTIPLFIKKLWKMVNDVDAENIISWNYKGDEFIIHDQLQFITKLLPRYFKHSNMASFVRQLNFYNFHKVPNLNNEIQFAHDCFIRDMPEVLPFIRRKTPVVKPKTEPSYRDQEVQELLKDVKILKGKHAVVDKELSMLKQENLALWTELNSLRVKYTKQSTIINMLIHFMLTYIHSHQTAFSKPNIPVSTDQHSGNNIKGGPPLLQIGYKNPKKFAGKSSYTVPEPGTSSPVMYSLKLPGNCAPEVKRPRRSTQGMDEMLSVEDQVGLSNRSRLKKPQRPGITYSIKLSDQAEKLSQPDIQRSLLEILKENEQLCEEETNEMFAELDSENFLAVEEDPDNPPDSADYTVSYPTEYAQEVEAQPTAHSPQAEPVEDIPEENAEVGRQGSVPRTITKEIPIQTPSGTASYTITYPRSPIFSKDIHENKVNVVDHLIIPNKTKNAAPNKMKTVPKFIKIPVKNIKRANNLNPAATKANLITIPGQKTSKQKLANISPTQPSNISNAEGTLLEILKENEKLTNDDLVDRPIQNLNIPQTNLESVIGDTDVEEALKHYMDDTDGANLLGSDSKVNIQSMLKPQPKLQGTVSTAVKNAGKNTNMNYNILENPKDHLNMYVDSTQEELDLLQDILNNLTSGDISEILSSQPNEISIDDIPVEDEEIEAEHISEEEPAAEYNLNMNESVDKYFQKHFLDDA